MRRRLAALAAELSDELYDTEMASFVGFLDQARRVPQPPVIGPNRAARLGVV